MAQARWVELDGADNVRDLAGLPTADGRTIQPGRLIRADSLQVLSDSDVRHLVDDLGVRAIADLRTDVEVITEGPGPMTREASVSLHHLSLFPEAGTTTDAVAADEPVVLPWQERDAQDKLDPDARRRGAVSVYLRYLDDRADSIVAALRVIAYTDGATVVHCAAGKDRAGTVIALALAEVGVPADEIAADYARSAERVAAIYQRLGARRTYANDVPAKIDPAMIERHKPRAETMLRVLAAIEDIHGGVPAWLRANGWTDADAAALRHHLLD